MFMLTLLPDSLHFLGCMEPGPVPGGDQGKRLPTDVETRGVEMWAAWEQFSTAIISCEVK